MPIAQKSILFLASWYPTPENPTHGVFIQNHAKALSYFTPVIVIYAYGSTQSTQLKIKTEGQLTEIILPYKKTTNKIPLVKHWLQYKKYITAYKQLRAYLIHEQISVSAIQVNVVFPATLVLPMFKAYYKVKHTVVEHWSGYLKADGNYKGILLKHFIKKCINSASKIWHVSQIQKQSMLNHGLTGNYELLYNAVDTTVFKPAELPKNTIINFLHVSSLVEREKNLIGTFKVLKKLQAKNLKFNLTIIGGSAESIAFAKEAQANAQLVNVVFTGYQTKQEIANYMNKCDALLLYSNYEGMPVVVLESLACGVPVFVSSVGQLPNIITSDLGIICKTDVELENSLEQFIENKLSFNKSKMVNFINTHASFNAVGKQLYNYYTAD